MFVGVESSDQLWPAPCSQDSDNLLTLESSPLKYFITKNVSFWMCQFFVNLLSLVSIHAYYCKQKLYPNPSSIQNVDHVNVLPFPALKSESVTVACSIPFPCHLWYERLHLLQGSACRGTGKCVSLSRALLQISWTQIQEWPENQVSSSSMLR